MGNDQGRYLVENDLIRKNPETEAASTTVGFYLMIAGNLLAILLSLYRQMEIARLFDLSWQYPT